MGGSQVKSVGYDKLHVTIFETGDGLAQAAASHLASILNSAMGADRNASVILASGNSQLAFIAALRTNPKINWSEVTIFHMDEYVGISGEHPASFRRFMREQLADAVHPRALYEIAGDALDVGAEMASYDALLRTHSPVACVLGIGENGHLAFNDPPADFDTEESIHLVTLAEASRRQQVSEGHFRRLDDVPHKAISLTVPALLRPPHVLAVVPEARKAIAVKAALEGEITPDCPASILRKHANVHLYLDSDSASLLELLD